MVDSQLAPGRVSEGRRIYAIGDVHGCLTRLVELHWRIAADLAAHPVRDSVLIHLGDYVDRGEDSAGVLWLLSGTVAAPVSRRVDLIGNHEVLMRAALTEGDQRAMAIWLDNGGEQTLASYDIQDPLTYRAELWRKAIPDAHIAWINRLDLMHREGSYLFVHAGLRPGVSIKAQRADDLVWIREPFLSDTSRDECVVVHGHTPSPAPQVLSHRIGIDTGAVMGGDLTCLVLEADRYRFLVA